jgi:hypothetical protein
LSCTNKSNARDFYKKVNFPVVMDKSTDKILPVISIIYNISGKALEVEVWMNDDTFILQEGEFELIDN